MGNLLHLFCSSLEVAPHEPWRTARTTETHFGVSSETGSGFAGRRSVSHLPALGAASPRVPAVLPALCQPHPGCLT